MASIKVFQEVLKRPIAYHGILARMLKSPTAAIMLSQGIYWQGKAEERGEYYFYVTGEQWYKQTGLTLENQMTARKLMSKKGIWLEVRKGVPARMFYRIDIAELWSQLERFVETEDSDCQIQEMPKSAISDSPNQVSGNNQNKSQGLPGTIIKTNIEINKDYIENNSANAHFSGNSADYNDINFTKIDTDLIEEAVSTKISFNSKEQKRSDNLHRADALQKNAIQLKEEFIAELERKGIAHYYEPFKAAWLEWIRYKKEIKNTYKSAQSAATGFKSMLEKSKYNPETALRIVETAVANCWKGLQEERHQFKPSGKSKMQEQHEDLVNYVMQKRNLLNG